MTVEPASTRANRINSDSLDWSYIGISFTVGHSTSARRARGRSTADPPSDGAPSLTAVLVIMTGITGAVIGPIGGAEGIRNDGHRSSARRRAWSSVKVCSLESEAFVIPKSQRDAVAECVEKVVLAIAASVTNAKALDLVKQMIS